jgi:hypothetical protein
MILLCFFAVANIDLTPLDTSQYTAEELQKIGFYDNERYLLSALVQSLAATIALVITLSLVAVQLAAQSYSARVIDVYKRNPDMWILLCIYIITIFYGLGLTKIIGLGILENYMEGAIFVAYFMGFFAFVCLVPYMLKTLDLLKPSTVIKLLAEEITKENIVESLKEDGEITERDPLQPIVDMINASLERNDYETMRNSIYAIKHSTFNLFENSKLSETEEAAISRRVRLHLESTGIHAVNINNEQMLVLIINYLEEMGNKTIQLKLNKAEDEVVIALQSLGRKAANHKLDRTVRSIIFAFHKISLSKIKNSNENTNTLLFVGIGSVGITAAEQKLKEETNLVVTTFGSLLQLAYKHENQKIIDEIKSELQNINKKSKENGWNFIIPSFNNKY